MRTYLKKNGEFEHIRLAEQALGKSLKGTKRVVHHVDKNGLNASPHNLVL